MGRVLKAPHRALRALARLELRRMAAAWRVVKLDQRVAQHFGCDQGLLWFLAVLPLGKTFNWR
ncbi:hypothetical protein [Epibacterium ulvae]|uniref:hypothetical protein n=1 Tax=Epibacterium ulvae TaxID=1156985 RepID=UPI000B7C66F0|nr:hypothetical protein [Epibacterium ulvae]